MTPAGHRFPLLILPSLETFCKTKTNSISLDHTHDGRCAGAVWEHPKPYVELKCCFLFKALVLAGDARLSILRIFHSSLVSSVQKKLHY